MSNSQEDSAGLPGRQSAELLETAETLVWSLLDDTIDDGQVARLQELLSQNEEARARYLDCVQLHVDLLDHFAAERAAADAGRPASPILAHLLDVTPEAFPGPLQTPGS